MDPSGQSGGGQTDQWLAGGHTSFRHVSGPEAMFITDTVSAGTLCVPTYPGIKGTIQATST